MGPPTTELERAMRDAHAPRDSLGGMEIGLNWITRTTDGQRIGWHNGGTGGFRAFAGFAPDRGNAVVVLTNSSIGADDIGFHAVFYDRVDSPVILIEFDHQGPVALDGERGVPTRRHVHTVVRTPNGNDYGKDLLRQHYEAARDDPDHGHVHPEPPGRSPESGR